MTLVSKKLDGISRADFTGIELPMPDVLSFANLQLSRDIDSQDFDTLTQVAKNIKKLRDERNLEIVMLQLFSNFEGWPFGSAEREDAFTRAKGWIRIMEAYHCSTLQVGSSDTPSTTLSSTRIDFIH